MKVYATDIYNQIGDLNLLFTVNTRRKINYHYHKYIVLEWIYFCDNSNMTQHETDIKHPVKDGGDICNV